MKNINLESDFYNAVTELKIIIQKAKSECIEKGFNFWPASNQDAPETFEALKEHGRIFPVLASGGGTSIYGTDINIDFRFWHDCLHIELEKDFSTSGENSVADKHIEYAKSKGASLLALAILEADTKGQIAYYHKFKEFVGNQTAFVQTCVNRGLKTALMVKM